MDKFIFASLVNEVNREILYISYNYNKDTLTESDIKKFTDRDYQNLSKSKIMMKFADKFLALDEIGDELDPLFIDILKKGNFNESDIIKLYRIMKPYIEFYMVKITDFMKRASSILDLKKKDEGFKGEFPLYLKVTENECIMERAVLKTNSDAYLNKETKNFGIRCTFMTYRIKLKNYSYNGVDLREKDKKEIIDFLDKSVSINLNNCEYQDTALLEIKSLSRLETVSTGEISFFFDNKMKPYGGVKEAFKQSLKQSGLSMLILIAITIIFFLVQYFIKK